MVCMSPRHFSKYMMQDPKGYQTFSDNMWNSFVSITHTIGLGKFFSFTPSDLTITDNTEKDYEAPK